MFSSYGQCCLDHSIFDIVMFYAILPHDRANTRQVLQPYYDDNMLSSTEMYTV